MKSDKEYILNENLWKVCLKLSIPAVIAMMLYGLNVIFDAFFISTYVGQTAFAGVSIVYPLSQFTLGLGSLAGTGAGSYLSILIGRADIDRQKRIVGNVNTLMIISTIIIMILGFIFVEPLAKMIGAEGEVLGYGVRYFKITLLGSFFWIAGLSYNMIVRAEGKMKTAAIMMAIGLIVNIIFNYIFMAILKFGVEGAAWATNIGMSIYVISFLVYASRGKASFEVNPYKLYFDKYIISNIVKLGIPSLLMSIMSVIQGLVIMRALGFYGTQKDVAFYGAVFRIFNFSLTPIFGLMRALQPTAGINYGAKNYKRVRSSYLVYSTVALLLMLPIWFVAFFFPKESIEILLKGTTVSSNDILNMRLFISIGPMLAFVMTAMTFFPSIEKPKPAAIVGLGRQLFLYIPLMLILPKIYGIKSIYIGSFLIDAFLTIVVALFVMREFKNLKRLENL